MSDTPTPIWSTPSVRPGPSSSAIDNLLNVHRSTRRRGAYRRIRVRHSTGRRTLDEQPGPVVDSLRMRIGAKLPNSGPLSLELGIPAMARALEDAGVDSVWVADHVVLPRTIESH